jgi:hypothetical protein
MKNSGLLTGFVPLVVYGVFAGNSVTSVIAALAAATLISLIVGWNDLRDGMILSWTNLVLFGSALVAIAVLGLNWIIPYMGILIYAGFGAVTFSSIAVGKPFTLQYARGMVDKSLWGNPFFIRVNVLMTGVWAGIFSINLGLSIIGLLMPGRIGFIAQVISYIVLVAGIIFTLRYPDYVRKKHAPIPVQYAG